MSEEKVSSHPAGAPVQALGSGGICLTEPVKVGAEVAAGLNGGLLTGLAFILNPIYGVAAGVVSILGFKKVSEVTVCETPAKAPTPPTAPPSCSGLESCGSGSLPKYPARDEKIIDRPPPPILPPLSLNQKKTGSMLG